jgi:hypothetical protein
MSEFNFPVLKYCLLSSTSSHAYFPANKPSEFTNKLVQPIVQTREGPSLEVGLVDLFYTPVQGKPKLIFGHTPGDNHISVTQRYEAGLFASKSVKNVFHFITECNYLFKEFQPEVEFNLSSDGHSVRIIFTNKLTGFKVHMSPEYARALGFGNQNNFPNGRNKAAFEPSQTIFEEIVEMKTSLLP